MREDMFKVIVERPRSGRSWATKSKLRYDRCEDRKRVSGHRLVTEHSGATKHLNENLAPLKRYLHKQVGRHWDDVFSDICKTLDTGSTVKMHVREHLDDFVMRKIYRNKDGDYFGTERWRSAVKLIDARTELYVDPNDGVLRRTRDYCLAKGAKPFRERYRQRWWGQSSKPPPMKKQSDTVWLVRMAGIWYKVTLSVAPISKHGYPLCPNELYTALKQKTWRDQTHWRVVEKRQLSNKALKVMGLENKRPEYGEAQYG